MHERTPIESGGLWWRVSQLLQGQGGFLPTEQEVNLGLGANAPYSVYKAITLRFLRSHGGCLVVARARGKAISSSSLTHVISHQAASCKAVPPAPIEPN